MHPIGRVWLNRLLDDFLAFSGLSVSFPLKVDMLKIELSGRIKSQEVL